MSGEAEREAEVAMRGWTITMRAAAVLTAGCGDDGGGGGESEAEAESEAESEAEAEAESESEAEAEGADCATPLPWPDGATVMEVSDVSGLLDAAASAGPGTVISLAAGTYALGGAYLALYTSGVTLRSADDDAEAVVIDGEYVTAENIQIAASDVTVAHVTITRAVDHPVHVFPPEGGPTVTGVRIHGVRFIDGGEQFLKINTNYARDAFADDGVVECSHFEMTDAGRPYVQTFDFTDCYTGGIDAHSAWGWEVRQNTFVDIYCGGADPAEHAIHFWTGSRDTLVENNAILNCARGVGLGLGETGNGYGRDYYDDPCPAAAGGYVGHYGGVIRNNAIWGDVADFDTGIGLEQACGASVWHNTVVSTAAATAFWSSIDYRFTSTSADIRNNYTRAITERNGGVATLEANVETESLDAFVDPYSFDFHLVAGATGAIDQGVAVDGAGLDLDGETHDAGAAPEIGADEYQP